MILTWAGNRAGLPSSVPSWQIVGVYGEVGFNTQTVLSGNERSLFRFPVDAEVDLTGLKVLSSAFYIDGTSLIQPTANDLVVGHSYWTTAGIKLFDDASARTTVTAGSGGIESSLYNGVISAGTRIWVNREIDVPSGGGGAFQTLAHAAGTTPAGMGRNLGGLGSTNLTTFFPTVNSSGYRMAPRAVIGYGVHDYTFAVIGDSIAFNNADANFGDGGATGVDGRTAEGGAWVRRAFMAASLSRGKQRPLAMSVRPSAILNSLQGSTISAIRAIYPYASVLLLQIGTNDLNAGRTSLQLKASVEAEIAAYKAAFSAANPDITPKAVVCTILPRQSSNPTSTAAGGATSKPEIIAYNAFVRNKSIAGQDGYLDPNAAVADVTDESMWASLLDNTDGTHPTTAGHVKIAAALSSTIAGSQPWL